MDERRAIKTLPVSRFAPCNRWFQDKFYRITRSDHEAKAISEFFGDFRGIFFKRKGRFGGRVCRRRRECGFYSGGNFGSREPRISDLESYY